MGTPGVKSVRVLRIDPQFRILPADLVAGDHPLDTGVPVGDYCNDPVTPAVQPGFKEGGCIEHHHRQAAGLRVF